MMRRLIMAAALSAGLFVHATPARAAAGTVPDALPGAMEEQTIGPAFREMIEIAGKQIPLPQGTWIVAGTGYTERRDADTEPYGSVQNTILVLPAGKTVAAVAVINTNLIGVRHGWDWGSGCKRRDIAHTESVGAKTDGACVFVNHVVTTAGLESAESWLDLLDFADRHRLALPTTWIAAGVTAATLSDFVDARFYFNPESRGLPPSLAVAWRHNDWHPERLAQAAGLGGEEAATVERRRKFLDQVTTWSQGFVHYLRAGLRGRLSVHAPLPLPWQIARAALPPEVTEKLHALRALHEEGVISADELRAQSDTLIAGIGVRDDAELSGWVRALAKSVSWRVVGSTDTMAVSWLLTGDVRTAGSIAVLEVFTKMVAYVGHEMAWDWLTGSGPRPNPIHLDTAGTDSDREDRPWVTGWRRLVADALPRGWLPPDWWQPPPQMIVLRPGRPLAGIVARARQERAGAPARTDAAPVLEVTLASVRMPMAEDLPASRPTGRDDRRKEPGWWESLFGQK